ncbi:MAG: TylF/MycF/NovP-related O-methyltransferase [Kiloniellales bacterium]
MTSMLSAGRRLAGRLRRWAYRALGPGEAEAGRPWRPSDVETDIPLRFPVDHVVADAKRACAAGDLETAIKHYSRALRLVNQYPPAKGDVDRIAKLFFSEAIALRDAGDIDAAIARLVRSRELNPEAGEVRDELVRLLGKQPPRRDLTTECFILPDPVRADSIYREAIRRCLEFVAYGGIVGEVLEFGVLAGWTARIFAETMRDLHYLGDLYLFDTFKGLPRDKHAVDTSSHDVGRGVWRDGMDISILAEEVGEPIDEHVRRSLSTVISPQRIKVLRGLFADTLERPLDCKAAVVHLDCDLYGSTREVLDGLARHDVLQDGTVLMFDDWNCNRANPAFGQRRAFAEFMERNGKHYTASHSMNYGFNSAAFILHDMTGDAAGSSTQGEQVTLG